jgi:glycosyltransferase involved in cell wall biosynthesis
MPTYNHQEFLQAAVEGVMSQVVDVPVLLIIRDDSSTDGTRELAEKLALRFPGQIELILNETNLFQTSRGAVPEILREILLRGGRFAAKSWLGRLRNKKTALIALCEGDDYWTDPNKLQRQLDVLRENRAVRLVHHDVEIVVEASGSRIYAESLRNHLDTFDLRHPNEKKGCFRKKWYFRDGHNVMTCSAMFRASAVDDRVLMGRPPGLAGDWIIFALICGQARPHFINARMATYRIHRDSFWSSMEENERLESGLATREFLHLLIGQ